MRRSRLLWVPLVLLFFCDLALPLSGGAFQFDPGQSLEISRVSVQTSDQLPPPQRPRFPAIAQPAPFPTVGNALRREATPPRTFVPIIRSPQNEVEALNSADPA